MKQVHNIATVGYSDGRESGAIVLELALILPFLVILFGTIVDLGLLVRDHQIVQNAAREGARFSSLPQNCIKCRPVNCADCVGGCGASSCKTQAQIQTGIENHVINYMAEKGLTITAGDIAIDQCFQMDVTVAGSTVTVFASEVTITYNHALLIETASLGTVPVTGRAVFRDLFGAPCP